MKIHQLWLFTIVLLSCHKKTADQKAKAVPELKAVKEFKRPTNGQEMLICQEALQDFKARYFAQVASRYRSCKQSAECVLWRSNPVNLGGIGPLQNCYIHWDDATPMCSPGGGVAMNLPGRMSPPRPDYALCQDGQCVAVFGVAPRNWKLDYRKAMMDAMDPAVPNAPDPDCLKGIPAAHRQDPSRVRRRFDSPL